VSDLTMPERLDVDEPIRFASGPIEGVFCIHGVEFADLPVRLEARRQAEEAWIDLVLYHGPERSFDFGRIAEAAIVFTLSIARKGTASQYAVPSVYASVATDLIVAGISSPRQTWTFQRTGGQTLSVTIPTKPLPTKEQKAATSAKAGEENPWKASK